MSDQWNYQEVTLYPSADGNVPDFDRTVTTVAILRYRASLLQIAAKVRCLIDVVPTYDEENYYLQSPLSLRMTERTLRRLTLWYGSEAPEEEVCPKNWVLT